jgi:hypothetical protein
MKIYDTFGDRMLIIARVFNGHSDTQYIADYSFSTQAATILGVRDRNLGDNAGYVAENIVMMITLTGTRDAVRKIVNMTDSSEYILTDSV